MNLAQVKAHLLAGLARQVAASGDEQLAALAEELAGYPPHGAHDPARDAGGVIVPLQVRLPDGGVLSMLSTITVFGTPVDITLSELALETFFPADEASAQVLRHLGDGQAGAGAG